MNTRSVWMGGSMLAALVIGLLAVPEVDAHGGGHSGGRAPRPPRVVIPQQNYRAPQMARAAAPARANTARSQAMARNAQARNLNAQAQANNAQARNFNTQAHANNAQSRNLNAQARVNSSQAHLNNALASANGTTATTTATRSSVLGPNPTTTAGTTLTGTSSSSTSPNTYTYGAGAGARSYRAYGYGRGYRNSYYGNRYGYGRSQGNNRAIVARLRSVHASLARIDHDYQGHRVRAMHAISMAIRQLSNRSMVYSNTGFAGGMNNGRAMGMQRGGLGGGAGRRGQPMNQAQSDSRMSQDLRALQGINMQLSNQGSNTMGHARARGHVQQAMHELNVALSIR